MNKRISCRAIIIDREKLVAMYREKNNRVYYTFPGGGIEENESEEACVIRECKEEFGIDVEVVKKVYIYEGEKTIEHFYICDWIDGAIGMGEGEEFMFGNPNGIYMPVLIPMEQVESKPLMPPEIKDIMLEDYSKNGISLRDEVTEVKFKV